MSNFYKYSATLIDGKEISMKNFKGKTILVVNTASKCGFTPQYEGLEKIYKEHKDNNFIILGFPCNQFANQELGNEEEIVSFCTINYGVTFPLFKKIKVNGKNTHPLFKYLKKELPGLLGGIIKWNFTKFLISSEGDPIKRYAPKSKPIDILPDIVKLINL